MYLSTAPYVFHAYADFFGTWQPSNHIEPRHIALAERKSLYRTPDLRTQFASDSVGQTW